MNSITVANLICSLLLCQGAFTSSSFIPAVKGSIGWNDRYWKSQQFILPNVWSWFGLKCIQLDRSFCLHAVSYDDLFSLNRTYSDVDVFSLGDIIKHSYHLINWFSLVSTDGTVSDSCCDFQEYIYKYHAQQKGVSPELYIDHMFDFYTSPQKHVNYVQASYVRSVCVNVIIEIGYGVGELKIEGDILRSAPFALPINRGLDLKYIINNNFDLAVPFSWFKTNVICRSQPWICKVDARDDVLN
ncbi:uncharacterized protein LOC142341100 isoform X1 [Convolutriloba macropyga]|uniref:uncharacterized protein LOC142341100 isoform X1 n=1 Tax=Convolutriloba macropyga TaxID=536237 RepID=UPI003F525110